VGLVEVMDKDIFLEAYDLTKEGGEIRVPFRGRTIYSLRQISKDDLAPEERARLETFVHGVERKK